MSLKMVKIVEGGKKAILWRNENCFGIVGGGKFFGFYLKLVLANFAPFIFLLSKFLWKFFNHGVPIKIILSNRCQPQAESERENKSINL